MTLSPIMQNALPNERRRTRVGKEPWFKSYVFRGNSISNSKIWFV